MNWFITPWCNYACKFCFATPAGYEALPVGSEGLLVDLEQARDLLRAFRAAGTRKLTFVGGEPTLVRALATLVRWTDELGMAPMVVTNGTGLTSDLLDRLAPHLRNPSHTGAIKLSLDSGIESVEAELGRGKGNHVKTILRRAAEIRARGIPLMVNTVVTARNTQEDMHQVFRAIGPVERWKVFQVLRIEGQNDLLWDSLKVSNTEFWDFVRRHSDLHPIAEDNPAMTASYVMVDPVGRCFQNTGGRIAHSRPILKVGFRSALSEVGWKRSKFLARNGRYTVSLPDGTDKDPT